MKELKPKYNHLEVEEGLYEKWLDLDVFKAKDEYKPKFSIVIPPPNVTGKLHLGHAWDNTLQDIIARYKREKGFDVLYLPGMDHAGIATQAKIDAKLKEQNISRYDIGREKFLDVAWNWKEEYASFIREQWKAMGIGLDYSRERFTLDEGLNKAVVKVFVDLYKDGLIYRDYKIINWDPVAKTALSNIEVIHKDDPGKMYYFNYKIKEKNTNLTVATTRPETMFGDVCVVVNPNDDRYKDLIGLHAINPANGMDLIIIGDEYVDIEFGTGAMKCTPAHDPNDFEIAERHNLEKPICMNQDATMNEMCFEFEGMDRFECREKLVEKIKNEGNLIKIEDIIHPVGHSERTDSIVEPYLSLQWFVKMKPLAQKVLEKQKIEEEKIEFFPERFENTFNMWLENIEDWTISRQLWWGHRIPAYYKKDSGEVYVEYDPPKNIEDYYQDEDVLDTWFSSALWPFSTLGWPEKTADFDRYFPTDVLVTGYDIIFFWVARMAIQARYFTNSYPFKHCLIHGLTRDSIGRKMSKSLGNGIDPLQVKKDYGSDALRFFLTTNSAPGQDIRYQDEKVASSWNFINKLWNASRFVMMNLPENYDPSLFNGELSDIDKWIIDKFNHILDFTSYYMDKYEFNIVGNELYSFIWEDFCNWYIELCKSELNSANKEASLYTLYTVLNGILLILHPFIPFVTDRIYTALNDADTICNKSWPNKIEIGEFDGSDTNNLISIIKSLREIKVENNLKPSFSLDYMVKDSENNDIKLNKEIINKITKDNYKNLEGLETSVRVVNGLKLYVLSEQLIDKKQEILKLNSELNRLEKEISRGTNILSNDSFIKKAPASKVEEEKNKLEKYKKDYELIKERLNELSK